MPFLPGNQFFFEILNSAKIPTSLKFWSVFGVYVCNGAIFGWHLNEHPLVKISVDINYKISDIFDNFWVKIPINDILEWKYLDEIMDITFGHVRVLEVDFSIIGTDSGSVKMIRNDSKWYFLSEIKFGEISGNEFHPKMMLF